MLELLHIENIAVIECAEIIFHKGFNVLTGETGAGKSIVIDAISAVLGERAYRDMIRTGTEKASVRAMFSQVPNCAWFEENNVAYDSEIIIHREIYLDGRNICKVNGVPVTVSTLRKLGIQLINIHGQHDSAALFDEDNHLELLDAFAGNETIKNAYSQAFDAVSDLRRQIERLQMDESEKLRKMETLQFQIQEIEKAELTSGEDTALNERRNLLRNAEKLSNGLQEAVAAIYGTEDADGASGLLCDAERELAHLGRYTDAFSQLHERVADLMYQVKDVAEELLDARDSLAYSGDELEKIEARLDVIHRLRRKYGEDCDAILAYLENAKNQLDEIAFAQDHVERLEIKLQESEKQAWNLAEQLRQSRKKTAAVLTEQILSELAQLDMPKVQFSCEFTPLELTANGADRVAFYMSANAGEALKPLSKVASGGELARIMLAMKNVLAQQDQVPTLIFDEVDTGVSGRAAQKVAQKLRAVSDIKQVLCVTHLPQLAALASSHLLIAKEERNGRTYTTVTPLDMEGRKMELARIIGGATITENTLKSAEEMLTNS